MEGKEYVILLSLLSEQNSFGNPRVFNFALNFVKKYLTEVNNPTGPEAQQFIKAFNVSLQQRLTKGEITKYSHSESLGCYRWQEGCRKNRRAKVRKGLFYKHFWESCGV
jgi:hypothetical protein